MSSSRSPEKPLVLDPDANHDVELITIDSVFLTLSLASVLARFASSKIKGAGYGLEEALLGLALVTCADETVMYGFAIRYGNLGRHASTLSQEKLVVIQKSFYAGSFLQFTSLASSKLSVLLLLRRIFITRGFRITVWILGGIVLVWWFVFFFAAAFICFPAKTIWYLKSEGTCRRQEILNYIWPIPWILTDFAILVSPLPVIKQLQVTRGQKIGLYTSFLLGGLTCIVSVVRYPTMFYSRKDISWNLVAPSTWTTIEVNTTIVCAAIIACRPFFALIFSATPFSHIQSAWSHMQSRISKKKKFFNSSYQLSSGRDACVNSTQSQEPSPILPLFTYPSNDSALRKSTETRNAVSTCEISAERRSGSSEEAL